MHDGPQRIQLLHACKKKATSFPECPLVIVWPKSLQSLHTSFYSEGKLLIIKISNLLNINIEIIISDSMTRPQRYGITGFAIGSSNINCLLDKKGFKDMYKNELVRLK